MKLFIRFFVLLLVVGIDSMFAQGEIDALRFSQSSIYGTGRSLGLGGAASAMGADLSAASLNPAGLGLYRQGEMVFTPSLRLINTNADFLGESSQASRSNLVFLIWAWSFILRHIKGMEMKGINLNLD